jgi:hypothetical protein
MNITKANVYDLENAVIASGYPKLPAYVDRPMSDITQKDYERASRLACVPGAGTGHDNFLKGILVSMDVTATLKWWIQAQRYSHFTIVSSMSTMHMAEHMPLRDMCKRLPEPMLSALVNMQDDCINGRISREDFLYALPVGLEYTARVTTNYMQLKTMYRQRRNHRLQEWQQFCDWVEGLIRSDWIVAIGNTGEEKNIFLGGDEPQMNTQSSPSHIPQVSSTATVNVEQTMMGNVFGQRDNIPSDIHPLTGKFNI